MLAHLSVRAERSCRGAKLTLSHCVAAPQAFGTMGGDMEWCHHLLSEGWGGVERDDRAGWTAITRQ
eukprot:749817-Rhodomonas_salina.1